MTNTCTIYIITNSQNKKVYIGQTWNSLSKRFQEHKSGNHNKKLVNAMNKYGRDVFTISVLDSCLTQNDANRLEILYINEYDSIKEGYNIREGGSRGRQSDETKEKISLAHIGKHHSNKTIKKISESQKGRKFSDETLVKMSQAKLGEKHPRSKLTWEIVKNIRNEYGLGDITYRQLSDKYDTDYGTIGKIINNLIWKI